MSKTITLKPHQVDAVWRCMTAGNTLLAHAVGAGKTMEMCASAMKMKQAGIIRASNITRFRRGARHANRSPTPGV